MATIKVNQTKSSIGRLPTRKAQRPVSCRINHTAEPRRRYPCVRGMQINKVYYMVKIEEQLHRV
ncbi:50S ribosomal protein L30 [Vibrio chagasii]|nr:50S ribosomal protein L30 [Vibrio chagasii]